MQKRATKFGLVGHTYVAVHRAIKYRDGFRWIAYLILDAVQLEPGLHLEAEGRDVGDGRGPRELQQRDYERSNSPSTQRTCKID